MPARVRGLRALGWTVLCVASLLACVACARPGRDADPAPDVAVFAGAALSIPCPTAGPDRDLDGLTDPCELALARGFAPVLRVAAGGCNWDTSVNPPRPGGGYLFVVEPAADSTIRLAYLPAYYRDCGWSGPKCWLPFVDCSPHTGDSEIILLDIAGSHAGDGWGVAGIFLSALPDPLRGAEHRIGPASRGRGRRLPHGARRRIGEQPAAAACHGVLLAGGGALPWLAARLHRARSHAVRAVPGRRRTFRRCGASDASLAPAPPRASERRGAVTLPCVTDARNPAGRRTRWPY